MCGFEQTVLNCFSDVSKIPILNQMIKSHKEIYDLFGSVMYHKPHYIFKAEYYIFHNINIGILCSNDTRMAGRFIGMYRYLGMRKLILAKFNLNNSAI